MTDRDTFAAAALTGLLAARRMEGIGRDTVCEWAYIWADAMLRERTQSYGKSDEKRVFVDTKSEPLTADEREAIKVCESDYSGNDMDAACWRIAATLRALLERTK